MSATTVKLLQTAAEIAGSSAALAKRLKVDGGDTAILASVGEFLLEGLYVNNRLSKFNARGKTFFKK